MRVPRDIINNLNSSKSHLEDADALPDALKYNATRYYHYLKAWELYMIANKKFSAWAQKKEIDPKLMRDHNYKFIGAKKVSNIKIVGGRVEITNYKSNDLQKLLKLLQYGESDKPRQEIFENGWFFDEFLRDLVGKISILEAVVKFTKDNAN